MVLSNCWEITEFQCESFAIYHVDKLYTTELGLEKSLSSNNNKKTLYYTKRANSSNICVAQLSFISAITILIIKSAKAET